MSICQHQQTKTEITTAEDQSGDIERTVCSNVNCNYIVREEQIIKRADGTEIKKPVTVSPERQPKLVQEPPIANVPVPTFISVEEMTNLAIETREKTIGKESRDLLEVVLKGCVLDVLKGKYKHEVTGISADIVSMVVESLKEHGYKVRKTLEPPKNKVWVTISWPTKKRKTKESSAKAKPQRLLDPAKSEEEMTFTPVSPKRAGVKVKDLEEHQSKVHQQQALIKKRMAEAKKVKSD